MRVNIFPWLQQEFVSLSWEGSGNGTVEDETRDGPYGAKEAGEGPLHAAIPAIANALYDASGIRLRELPFTPARVLAAIKARDARRAIAAQRTA